MFVTLKSRSNGDITMFMPMFEYKVSVIPVQPNNITKKMITSYVRVFYIKLSDLKMYDDRSDAIGESKNLRYGDSVIIGDETYYVPKEDDGKAMKIFASNLSNLLALGKLN